MSERSLINLNRKKNRSTKKTNLKKPTKNRTVFLKKTAATRVNLGMWVGGGGDAAALGLGFGAWGGSGGLAGRPGAAYKGPGQESPGRTRPVVGSDFFFK